MKRYILLAILSIINIMAIASSPKLASEKIFEDIDLYDPSLSVTIMERPDQSLRTLSFRNKPDLKKKIKKALDSDKEKAVSKSLVSENGEISESIVIINEDEEIKIGLTNSKNNEVYFFVKSLHKNNSNNVKRSSKSTKTSKASKKRTAHLNSRKKSNKTPKTVKTITQEQMLDDGTLIIIETYNSDLLTEI